MRISECTLILIVRNAKVLCVGAGGLGAPTILYLAAAGVGTIGILDFDLVELSNLQRQVIHSQFSKCSCEGKQDSSGLANQLRL